MQASVVDDNGIKYIARQDGTAGNGITIDIVPGSTSGVVVAGSDITVTLEDEAELATSTITAGADEITITAVAEGESGNGIIVNLVKRESLTNLALSSTANAQANEITVYLEIDGSTDVLANFTTALTGTNNDLVFTSKLGGGLGNTIQVSYVDPVEETTETTALIVGNRIMQVALAATGTPGSFVITATAADVKAAIEANLETNNLVTVANAAANDGTGVVTLTSFTLANGTFGDAVSTVQEVIDEINNNADNTFVVASLSDGDGTEVVESSASATTSGGITITPRCGSIAGLINQDAEASLLVYADVYPSLSGKRVIYTGFPITLAGGAYDFPVVDGVVLGGVVEASWFGAFGSPADTDVAEMPDETTQLQDAINAAIGIGGVLRLQANTYKITSPLVISGPMTIEGAGVTALYGDRSVFGSDIYPTDAPYLTGSVILMATAATDAIHVSAVGCSVSLLKFGVRFSDSFKFTNTGHGINCDPGAYLTGSNNGIGGGTFDSVYVYGTDGDHYAFRLVNVYYMVLSEIEGWGGGGMNFHVDTPTGFYGNSTVINPYFCHFAGGTAHGYALTKTFDDHAPIYINFVRPQTFGYADEDLAPLPTASQYLFYATDDIQFITWTGPDFEGGDIGYQSTKRLPTTLEPGHWFGPGGSTEGTLTSSNLTLELGDPTLHRGLIFQEGGVFQGLLRYVGLSDPDASHQGAIELVNQHTRPVSLWTNATKRFEINGTGEARFLGGMLHTGAITPSFRAHQSGSQTIPNETFTVVVCPNEDWDITGALSGATFTPLVAGRYTFHCGINFDNVPNGTRISLRLYKNGAVHTVINDIHTQSGGADELIGGSCMASANGTTDYFELYVYQSSGGNLDINGLSGSSSVWWNATLTN